jgi:hypothetical protein
LHSDLVQGAAQAFAGALCFFLMVHLPTDVRSHNLFVVREVP